MTGFKKKNDDELMKSTIEDVEKYSELLYDDQYELKVKGARAILYLATDPANIIKILSEKETLLGVLARTLKDEHKKSTELLLHLLAFFYGMSYYENFHSILAKQSIGGSCMNIIDFQYAKYLMRREEIVRLSQSSAVSKTEYQSALDMFLFLVRKQDRILRLAFTILMHLAEDPKVEVKMVKMDIVGLIVKHLDRSNINLLVVMLLFLKKLSIFHVNKDAMIKANILDHLMNLFEIQHPLVFFLTIQNIFNLSFDSRFRQLIVEKEAYFKKIADCFKLQEFRGLVLRILYNLSLEEKAKPLFYDTDSLFILYELLYNFPEKIIGAELAALTLNLTTYPQNARKLATNGRVKGLLERAFTHSDFELIKIVKNILKFSEDKSVNEIFESFIDDHFIKILNNKSDGNEFLIETVEILSNIDTDWQEKLEKHNLIPFFEKHLKEGVNNNYDELLLAIILFLGNIATNSDCSSTIANSKIIPLLYSNFEKKSDNYSIVFAIIYTLYQLIPWEDTRKLILSNPELIKRVLWCLKCDNSQIMFVSLNFLEIVQLYDPKWSEMIKRKKFKIYNRDFMNYLKTISQLQGINYGNMKFGSSTPMICDEDDDDEEFRNIPDSANEYDDDIPYGISDYDWLNRK